MNSALKWKLIAGFLLVFIAGGAWVEFDRNDDAIAASGNEFAIADSAIQDEVAQ